MHNTRSIHSLTVLRFFAAIIVALHHTVNYFSWPHLVSVKELAINGWLCVDFFFILSGFVLMWSFKPNEQKYSFIWKRIIRIYPLHIITLIISIIAYYTLGNALAGYNGGIKGSILNLFLLQAWLPNNKSILSSWNGVSWSLSVEMFFYITAPILFCFLLRFKSLKILTATLFCLWSGLLFTAMSVVSDSVCITNNKCLFNSLNLSSIINARTATEQFVNSLYSIVLNRPADAEGLAYWMNQINSGLATRAAVAQEFLLVDRRDFLLFLSYHPLVKWIDFILGAGLAILFIKMRPAYSNKTTFVMATFAIFLILSLISLHHYLASSIGFPVISVIDTALFVPGSLLLIFSACCWDQSRYEKYKLEAILIFLGESSFAIYMIHALVLGAVAIAMDKVKWFGLSVQNITIAELVTLAYLFLFIALGSLTHKYIENPIRFYLLKIMKKYQIIA